MTDADLLPLLEKHLGLRARRDDTVINPKTSHFTDLQRYRDLAAAIEARSRQPAYSATDPRRK